VNKREEDLKGFLCLFLPCSWSTSPRKLETKKDDDIKTLTEPKLN